MANIKRAAVLAAGSGTRIQSISRFKPMLLINGRPMVEVLIQSLRNEGMDQVLCAFNTAERQIPFNEIGIFQDSGITRIHVDTASSMHTLWEAFRRMAGPLGEAGETHLLVSMVDTILRPEDLGNFMGFCRTLRPGASAVLTTSYIDDEKPLYLQVNPGDRRVLGFSSAPQDPPLITSGMYCFSLSVLPVLEKAIEQGMEKMRNFLAELVQGEERRIVYSFEVEKTFDVDRPEDVAMAESFLALNS